MADGHERVQYPQIPVAQGEVEEQPAPAVNDENNAGNVAGELPQPQQQAPVQQAPVQQNEELEVKPSLLSLFLLT